MSVKADIPTTTDLLGKTVSDLQENVNVNVRTITGTLKYVTDYTGFSGDVSEQSGNYIALHITSTENDVTIKVKLRNEVTLDADGIIILRVTDESPDVIKVTATKQGFETTVQTYDISRLVLEEP